MMVNCDISVQGKVRVALNNIPRFDRDTQLALMTNFNMACKKQDILGFMRHLGFKF